MVEVQVIILSLILCCQSFATATTETRVELKADADNAPALQGLLDTAVEGSVVRIPAGTWDVRTTTTISKRLTIEGPKEGEARLRLIASNKDADVLRIGVYGNLKVNGVTMRRLTLEVAGEAKRGQMQCLEVHGDDFTAEDCIWVSSPHEGVVVHGGNSNATFRRCKAVRCGLGNEFYERSTAGFNSHSTPTIYEDCETFDCGQGFELDGHHTRVRRVKAFLSDPAVSPGPAIGFNIGSAVVGVWDIEIAHSKSIGYGTSLQAGNGRGRFADLNVHHCLFDGEISVAGGEKDNHVGNDSPDTGQSHFDDNVIIKRGTGDVLTYKTGMHEPDQVRGREPFTFRRNVIYYASPVVSDGPTFGVAGKIVVPVVFEGNRVFGRDDSPIRGDFQTYWSFGQKIDLKLSDNKAFKLDGTERPLTVNLEGG